MRMILPLLALLCGACAGPHGVRDWTGPQSEIPTTLYLVAQDQADWAKLWERVGRPAPPADLEQHFGVAIFLGDKRPGEYKFAWNYVTQEDRTKVLVGYNVYRSGTDDGPRTRPYGVFLFPRSIARAGAQVLVEDQTPGGAGAL